MCFDPFGSFAAERSVAVFLLRRALPSLAMCLLTRMVAGGRNDIVCGQAQVSGLSRMKILTPRTAFVPFLHHFLGATSDGKTW